ncbi:hypothetical protein CDL12_01649 [Handroanthus impetiginosus]|uniref:Uncharacterized protein n=1 Tax=Handroanthus impetiginosus TaxID=429701 RepID=A0A2G9I757_9LAMI|nr:hypothetical protein CDL12_01649 [Handroanthus impetiginosus]
MSDKEWPRPDDGGGGGGSGGADDDDGEGPTEKGDPKQKKCKGCGKKGKKVSLFRLRKGKKLLHQKRTQKGVSVNSGCWGRRAGGGGSCGGGSGWCCLSMKQPRNPDSSVSEWAEGLLW